MKQFWRGSLLLCLLAAPGPEAAAEDEIRIVDDRPALSVNCKKVLREKGSDQRQVMLLEDGSSVWFGRQPGTGDGYLVYFDEDGRAAKEVLVSQKRQSLILTEKVLEDLGPGHVFYRQREKLQKEVQSGQRLVQNVVATVKVMTGQTVIGVHQVFLHQLKLDAAGREDQDLSLDAVSHAVAIYDLKGRRLYGFEDKDIGTVLGVSPQGRYFVYSSEVSGDLVLVKRPGTKIQGWSRKKGTFFDYRFTDNERYLLLVARSGFADVFDLEKKAFVVPEGQGGSEQARDTFRVSKDLSSVEIISASKKVHSFAVARQPAAREKFSVWRVVQSPLWLAGLAGLLYWLISRDQRRGRPPLEPLRRRGRRPSAEVDAQGRPLQPGLFDEGVGKAEPPPK
jgi:hypothetical protein